MSGSAFGSLHVPGEPFVLPNDWDVASGVLLADSGFPAVGTTSVGVTAALGLPDGAGAGREPTTELATRLAAQLHVPVSVDLEGGYSDDPGEVAGLVVRLAEAGVQGVNLEDGRADGSLRAVEHHSAVLRAVVDAAPGVFVNARTDTSWLAVGDASGRPAETARRLLAYRDAGASGVFAPGLTDLDETARLVVAVGLPLNVLWRPETDLTALAGVGVARVSTGSALYRHALGSALDVAVAARGGEQPSTTPVGYAALQRLLAGRR